MNVPGICGCGCGKSTLVIPRSDAKRGLVRGEHFRFRRGHSLAKTRPIETRFWGKVTKGDGCWEWCGSRKGGRYGGYGTIFYGGKTESAHRVAYQLTYGVIPDGMVVCHRCDHPPCVRPDHLFLGTLSDNAQDCVNKGRHRGGERNARKTHCPSGHPYEGENIIWRASNNSRECRICHYNAMTRYQQRRAKGLVAS